MPFVPEVGPGCTAYGMHGLGRGQGRQFGAGTYGTDVCDCSGMLQEQYQSLGLGKAQMHAGLACPEFARQRRSAACSVDSGSNEAITHTGPASAEVLARYVSGCCMQDRLLPVGQGGCQRGDRLLLPHTQLPRLSVTSSCLRWHGWARDITYVF